MNISALSNEKSRARGLRDELNFWAQWVKTKSLAWPGDFENRLDPNSPLSHEYCAFIDHLPQEEIQILDVGAGPLTILGKKHPSKRLIIQAVDVLAESYDELLARYHVQPVVRTTFADAERLTEKFAEDEFELVTARNCLDHAADPVEAIRQILLVTKRGCFAVLDHAENEGETQSYHGLHQWNFTIIDRDLIVRGVSRAVNVSRQLSSIGEFRCSLKDNWVKVCILKK
jgi:SAM-dependent methyltransferase